MSGSTTNTGAAAKSRRHFLKSSGHFVAASALTGLIGRRSYAAGNSTIKLALVGCGGRGTGAVVDALSAKGGPVKLCAMADLFEKRLQSSLDNLTKGFKDKIDVPPERRFIGFDAYKKAMACLSPGDVVLLTTHAARGIPAQGPQSRRRFHVAPFRCTQAGDSAHPRRANWRRPHNANLSRARAGCLPTTARRCQRAEVPASASEQFHMGLIRLLHRLALSQHRRGLLGQRRVAGLGAGIRRPLLREGRQPVRPLYGRIHLRRRHETIRLLAAHDGLLGNILRLRARLERLGGNHGQPESPHVQNLQEPQHGPRRIGVAVSRQGPEPVPCRVAVAAGRDPAG